MRHDFDRLARVRVDVLRSLDEHPMALSEVEITADDLVELARLSLVKISDEGALELTPKGRRKIAVQ